MRSGSDRSYLLRVGFIPSLYTFRQAFPTNAGGPSKSMRAQVDGNASGSEADRSYLALAPGPYFLFSWSILSPDSFAKRRDFRSLATALACGRTMGTCTRSRCCCSPNLSTARNMRVHTFWSYFFGWSVVLALVHPPVAGDPRSPATYFGLKLVSGPCARPCGRCGPVRFGSVITEITENVLPVAARRVS